MFRRKQSLKFRATFIAVLDCLEIKLTYGEKKYTLLFLFYKESQQVFTFLLAAEQTGCWREAEDQRHWRAGRPAPNQSSLQPGSFLSIQFYKETFPPRSHEAQ